MTMCVFVCEGWNQVKGIDPDDLQSHQHKSADLGVLQIIYIFVFIYS